MRSPPAGGESRRRGAPHVGEVDALGGHGTGGLAVRVRHQPEDEVREAHDVVVSAVCRRGARGLRRLPDVLRYLRSGPSAAAVACVVAAAGDGVASRRMTMSAPAAVGATPGAG